MQRPTKDDIQNHIENQIRDRGEREYTVYERYRGKELYGSKSWPATEAEKKTVTVLTTIAFVVVAAALAGLFLQGVPTVVKIILFLVAFCAMAAVAAYLIVCVRRHHKEDPIEVHYYDVDYAYNYLTGKGYDNTREISREEFYNIDKSDQTSNQSTEQSKSQQ